jgi:hypothetical protein
MVLGHAAALALIRCKASTAVNPCVGLHGGLTQKTTIKILC